MAATGKKAPVASKKTDKKGKKPVAARRKTRKTAGKGIFDGYIPGMYAENLGMTAANFALMRRAELRAKKIKSMKDFTKEEKIDMRRKEKKSKEELHKLRVKQGKYMAAVKAARRKGQSPPNYSLFVQPSASPRSSNSNHSQPSASPRSSGSNRSRPRSNVRSPAQAGPVTVPGGFVQGSLQAAPAQGLIVEAQDVITKIVNKKNNTLSQINNATKTTGVTQKTRLKLVRINAILNGVLVGTMTISHSLPTSRSSDTSNMGKALNYEGRRIEYLKAIRNNLFANVKKAPRNFKESKTTYVIEALFSENLGAQLKKQVFGVMLKAAQAEAQLKGNPYIAVLKSVDGNAATSAANFAAKINNGGSGGTLFRIQ